MASLPILIGSEVSKPMRIDKKMSGDEVCTGVIYYHQKRTWDSKHSRRNSRTILTNKSAIMQVIIKVGKEVAKDLF